jgi:hypothetical protein
MPSALRPNLASTRYLERPSQAVLTEKRLPRTPLHMMVCLLVSARIVIRPDGRPVGLAAFNTNRDPETLAHRLGDHHQHAVRSFLLSPPNHIFRWHPSPPGRGIFETRASTDHDLVGRSRLRFRTTPMGRRPFFQPRVSVLVSGECRIQTSSVQPRGRLAPCAIRRDSRNRRAATPLTILSVCVARSVRQKGWTD